MAITNEDAEKIANYVWSESLSGYNCGAGYQMQCQSYRNYVTVDSTGEAGTIFPIGMHCNPVNNLTDALVISGKYGIDRILLHNSITIEATHNISGMAIETHGVMGTNVTLNVGCSADNCVFRYLNLQGTVNNSDTLLIENCSISDLENFTGIMQGVSFTQGSEMSIGTWAEIYNCRAGGDPGNEPEISIGDSVLNIQQYRGNLKLKDKTADNRTVASFLPGNVIIDSTCVSGSIQILGVGEVEQDNSGDNCKVDLDAAITNEYIADAVLNEDITEHSNANSLGLSIQKTLGLLHSNIYIDNTTYDSYGNLAAARVRVYSNAGSVGTANDIIGTYQITSVSSDAGRFTTWEQVEA